MQKTFHEGENMKQQEQRGGLNSKNRLNEGERYAKGNIRRKIYAKESLKEGRKDAPLFWKYYKCKMAIVERRYNLKGVREKNTCKSLNEGKICVWEDMHKR